jgi:hypothetical protein
MHTLIRCLLSAVAVVALWWSSSDFARAQDMRGDIYTPLRPGPYTPYDGAPFSHRYNYPSPPYLFLTTTPDKLAILDAIDREERAEKFGHLRSTKPPLFNRIQDRWRSR